MAASYLTHNGKTQPTPAREKKFQLLPSYVEKLFRLGFGAEEVNRIEAALEKNGRPARDFERSTGGLKGVNKEAVEAETTPLEAAAKALLNADPLAGGPPWKALGEAAEDFSRVAEFLLSPKGWLRMAEIFGGAILLYWGLKQLTGLDPAAGVQREARRFASKGAA